MKSLSEFTTKIQSRGQQMFTVNEAVQALGKPVRAVRQSLARLKKKGEIVSPLKGLYVVVPPSDLNMGCINEQDLLVLLMEHLRVNYYVAFLSAGQFYGASHQKPMVLQVVAEKKMRRLQCGHVRIWFTYKKDISSIPVNKKVIHSGDLIVSTPEATAMDIITHPNQSVGINNIATVLSELIEEIEISKLIDMANIVGENAWVQRMGYILENINSIVEDKRKKMIIALQNYLATKKLSYVPLSSSEPRRGTHIKRWKIIENTTVESDL